MISEAEKRRAVIDELNKLISILRRDERQAEALLSKSTTAAANHWAAKDLADELQERLDHLRSMAVAS